jgi:hypothetical protein
VDANFNHASKVRRTRKREFNYEEFAPDEEKALVNTPGWTRSGYNGSLRSYIEKQIDTFSSPPPPPFEDLNDVNNRDKERNNRSRKSRSVVSEEYDSNSEETDDE